MLPWFAVILPLAVVSVVCMEVEEVVWVDAWG